MEQITICPREYTSLNDLIEALKVPAAEYFSKNSERCIVTIKDVYASCYLTEDILQHLNENIIWDEYEGGGQGGSLLFKGHLKLDNYYLEMDGVLWSEDIDSNTCFDNISLVPL
jgi:hypothetical protein